MTAVLRQTAMEVRKGERNHHDRRSVPMTLAAIEALAVGSEGIIPRHLLLQDASGRPFWLPRYLFIGPRGGDRPMRVAIFAGIHGDEPEGVHATLQFLSLLDRKPELAQGFCLSVYPICNPSGFEDHTRHSRSGHDLNREFWKESKQPEVVALQNELTTNVFDGIVALHSDDSSEGYYGYARGATLTRSVLEPALNAAGEFLPRDRRDRIDGFPAQDGVVHECFEGVLSPPATVRPSPFEIIFETPQHAMPPMQHAAMVAVLTTVLAEYRKLAGYARHI